MSIIAPLPINDLVIQEPPVVPHNVTEPHIDLSIIEPAMNMIDNKFNIIHVDPSCSMLDYIHQNYTTANNGDCFHVMDLRLVQRQLVQWRTLLPRVDPYYAVKSNSDSVLLHTLYTHGTGFDCASKAEIQIALSLGATPNRIIFANPAKFPRDLIYAAENGITMMTFDSVDEIIKIAKIYYAPERTVKTIPQAVLRIATDDSKAQCRLSTKFGAAIQDAKHLLLAAKEYNIPVIGVSFHCGSGATEVSTFTDSIINARNIFNIGLDLGHPMHLLDVGGGWPGDDTAPLLFSTIADAIRPLIDELFPENASDQYPNVPKMTIIAEPGRYFCHSSMMFASPIISLRRTNGLPSYDIASAADKYNATLHATTTTTTTASPSSPNNEIYPPTLSGLQTLSFSSHHDKTTISTTSSPETYYYIGDGIYGAFNNILHDHYIPQYPYIISKDTYYSPLNILSYLHNALKNSGIPLYTTTTTVECNNGCTLGNIASVPSCEVGSPCSPTSELDNITNTPTSPIALPALPTSSTSSSTSHHHISYDKEIILSPSPDHTIHTLRYSKIFGPTCDGLDTIFTNIPLPSSLTLDDWLIFPDMGAYTITAQSSFNGIPRPSVIYIRSIVSPRQ